MRISDWSSDVCSSDLEEKRRRSHADMPGNQGLAMIQPALTAFRPQPGSYGLRHFAFARGWMGLLFGNLFRLSQGKYAIPHETVHLTQIVPHKLPYFRAAAIEGRIQFKYAFNLAIIEVGGH